jgi:hypothetical protein
MEKLKNAKKTAQTLAKTPKASAKKSNAATTAPVAPAAENTATSKKIVDSHDGTAVDSAVTQDAGPMTGTTINTDQKDQHIMTDTQTTDQTQNADQNAAQTGPVTATLDAKDRSTIMVVYTLPGRPGSVRFSKTLFPDSKAPATIEFPAGLFAGPKVPRAQETKEQRKARLAARPKPTAAEKMARLEQKLAKLRAKVQGEGAPQGENAPQGETVGAGV